MSQKLDLTEVSRIRREGGNNPVEEIVDAGRKFYCGLYSNNPYWTMVRNTIIIPIATRVLDNICSDFPPPPPPRPKPFEGGQCEDILYTVNVTLQRRFNNGSPVTDPRSIINIPGKVTGVELRQRPSDTRILEIAIFSSFNGGSPAIRTDVVGGVGVTATMQIDSIVREDGQPDNCGDPPSPGYDPIPPPSPEDTSGNITITNNEGDSYEYNVSVNLDEGGTVVFPPVINVGGISVTLDVGGVTIDNSSSRRSGGGGGSDGDAFSPEEADKEPELLEEETEEEEEGETKEVEKLIAIIVNLTKIPTNTSVSDGRGAPDVYYAGWVEFKNKSTYYERQFIHFSSSRFNAPEQNDGYAITYKEGFAGTVTEITEKTEETN